MRISKMAAPRAVTVAVSIAVCAAVYAAMSAATATVAHAQTDVDLDRGATAETYIRKRPLPPESPQLTPELTTMLEEREAKADAKRAEAIELLRTFIASAPTGDAHAEALFKLAELLWEDSRRQFIANMDRYERELEACSRKGRKCKQRPKEPRIDLAEPTALYLQLLAEHPDFRRADLVLYLVGFATMETESALKAQGYFRQVIDGYPDSPLYGDAWMMIGEYEFGAARWETARAAYANVLERPQSASYDMALFKTAWCDWKLGDPDLAARRFKRILDLAEEAERSGNARTRRRRAQLRDEALEYLVIVFTEDRTISAAEVYEFLASIGGERYSRDVLVRVADAYYAQSEYDLSVNTYRFLIEQNPDGIDAAEYQRKIVESYTSALMIDNVITELGVLVETYGPNSLWQSANTGFPTRLERSLRLTETLARGTATEYHAEAQENEKREGKVNIVLYKQAAAMYEAYLRGYTEGENVAEVRFLRADILFFKLEQYEAAGDAYLAVGQSQPVGKYHKDALLKAIDAFEKARPPAGQRGTELAPADRKFAAAVDLYATLFPADPELVGVIFRNGQLFYDYGDYDEAIKRFGLIVTKYPEDPNAGPAGDRILGALAQAEDYENITEWARKLKGAKAFQSNEQQRRLDRLIVESMSKSGERYADQGQFDKAAGFYLRIPEEFPQHPMAPQAIMNAGVVYERAKNPEKAATTYLQLAERFPKSKQAPGAAFNAAKVYESVAYFDRAADAYEVVIERFPRSDKAADALFNAALIRQSLGQNRRAIRHYRDYAKRHRKRKDADEVSFQIGVVYERAGEHKQAAAAFRGYIKRHKRSPRVIEAHTRAGRSELAQGKLRPANKHFDTALKLYRRAKKRERKIAEPWAAEARYYQGELIFRRFEAISLAVKPRRLRRRLDEKADLLAEAQDVYLDVVDYGDAQWATAALYRMGGIYEAFAESLRTAPVPSGLSEEEAQMYREELENYVVEVEEQAIDLHATGYQKAIDLQVYNEYTRKLREALSRLDAMSYPPALEARADVRFGDRAPQPVAVTEVVRDE